MLPDFNRLRVFYFIYTRNGVARAATELHLSQPAVSQQLQKLEAELKVKLFTRLHKKLVPTSAGQKLFAMVEPFVKTMQEGAPRLKLPSGTPSGCLRIGAPTEFGKKYLPTICHSFRKEYPDVTFSCTFAEASILLSMIEEGSLDMALSDIFDSNGGDIEAAGVLSMEPLVEEEIILACSRKYYEENIDGRHGYDHLVSMDFICDELDAMSISMWFRHHFGKVPPKIPIVFTVDNHAAMISAMKQGMGLGITASHILFREIRSGSVTPVLTRSPNNINKICLVQLQDKVPTLTEKTFTNFLKKAMKRAGIQKKFTRLSED